MKLRIAIPKFSIPRLPVPKLAVAKLAIPKLKLPRIGLPKLKLPRLPLPRIKLPKIGLPRIRIPKKVALGLAALLVLGSGGAGAAIFMGYLPSPFASEEAQAGGHGEAAAEHPPAEGESAHGEAAKPGEHGTAEEEAAAHGDSASTGEHAGNEQAAGHGGEGAAAGEHGGGGHGGAGGEAAAPLVDPSIVYDIPPRGKFLRSVRYLVQAQTAAAVGLATPELSQREAISKVQIELQEFDPAKATRQELESLGIYLLSGGNPRGLSGVISHIPHATGMTTVLQGAHDYVIGDFEKAKAALLDAKLDEFSPSFSARIALAQSALVPPEDYAAQAAALKKAVSLAPGTLVEEAAFRRLISLAVKNGKVADFVRFSRRYMRRFPTSLYISDFVRSYSQGVLQFEDAGTPVPLPDVMRLLTILPPAASRSILLELRKESAKMGLRDLCLHLGEEAFARILTEPSEMQRLKLYGFACNVVEDPEGSATGLKALSGEGFSEEDNTLRNDALRLATAMSGDERAAAESAVAGPEQADPETSALQVSATQQLQASKEVLQEAVK